MTNFWCWRDAKFHPLASVRPKWHIEGGLIARLGVQTFLPKAILGIYDSELLCLRLPPLSAFGSALNGWLCSNDEGQDICVTCWVWQQPTYWKHTQLVQLQVQEYCWLLSHIVSRWSGLLKVLVHSDVDVLQVGLCHQWQCGTCLGGNPSLQRHLCISLEGQQSLLF